MTSYPPRKATGNRAKDVVDPLWQEAEERVYAWLVQDGYAVTDARKQKTHYDFALDNLWTLDVKCDQYAASTGRFAWELFVDYRGHTRRGWGGNINLDYIAYVTPHDWFVYLVDAAKVRALLAAVEAGEATAPAGMMVSFSKQGADGRTGIGVALGIEWLDAQGCIVKRGTALREAI
jgi:hypothetical protein